MRFKRILLNCARYFLLILLAVFMAAPFIWMAVVSLLPSETQIPDLPQMVSIVRSWLTLGELPPPSIGNYPFVLLMPELPVFRFLLNSVFVTGSVVAGQLLVCSMAAYAFARLQFIGRDLIFRLFLISMMFAGVVVQIPVYMMVRSFGWLDTYAALIVPGLSSAFNIFLLRQYFITIPRELDDAAKMDGAGDWLVYWKVILPMSKASLATAAAFTFVATWTDFFWPLLATSSLRMRTLEVGLSVFKNSYGATNWPLQMTAAVITMLPMALVFLLAQRYFIRGISLGSIK